MSENLRVDIRDLEADAPALHPRIQLDVEFDFGPTDVNQQPFDIRVRPEIKCGTHTALSMNSADVDYQGNGRIRDPTSVRLYLNLTYEGLERIEQIREEENEKLELRLQVTALWWEDNRDQIKRTTTSGNARLQDRDWEAVLDELDWQERRVVAFSIPDSAFGDVMDNAFSQIEKAEEHHNARRYDDALIAVRKAMEKVQNFEDDQELMSRLDSEKRKRLERAIDEFDASIHRFVNIADLGGHTEELITDFEGPIRRRDSELAVDVGKAYVRYIGQVLEDD